MYVIECRVDKIAVIHYGIRNVLSNAKRRFKKKQYDNLIKKNL